MPLYYSAYHRLSFDKKKNAALFPTVTLILLTDLTLVLGNEERERGTDSECDLFYLF